MAYRTLGELRSELQARCGFAASGSGAGVSQVNMNSILRQAQVALYNAADWARLRRYETVSLGVNQYLTDYPSAANPDRIKAISVLISNVWSQPLKKGIPPQLYTTQASTSWPQRWEPYAQIETWPKSNAIYSVRIFYIKLLDAFTEDAHRTSIDDDMVFTLALADAKEHFRHPDAKTYRARADAIFTQLKAKSWGQQVFSPYDYAQEEVQAKPEVV